MILAITERYALFEGKTEVYNISIEFKEIFEKLNVLLFPVSTLTNLEQVVNICDGLIVTGSSIDINPKYYNEVPKFEVEEKSEEIDTLDFELIKAFDNANKPIMGICRGIQSINVCFGGSLHQDIENHKLDKEKRHLIKIEKESFLYDCYRQENLEVNSLHHQAINRVADNFRVTAISENGIVEGIEKDNIVAVQWHPEMMYDMKFFESFIKKVVSHKL